MDPITFRFIERILAVVFGGMAIYLGYRLFVRIPESRDSQGKITLPWNITVILSRVGPGVFFALFGTGVIALSLYKGVQIGPGTAFVGAPVVANKVTGFIGAAPRAPEAEPAARADARALLRRDIGLLNNITNSLRPDLPDYERTPIELAIPRIKLALMKPVWGETEAGWGTPSEFEEWVKEGELDPAPQHVAQAVEYYRYAKREAKP
jgi:hypothetical protein